MYPFPGGYPLNNIVQTCENLAKAKDPEPGAKAKWTEDLRRIEAAEILNFKKEQPKHGAFAPPEIGVELKFSSVFLITPTTKFLVHIWVKTTKC